MAKVKQKSLFRTNKFKFLVYTTAALGVFYVILIFANTLRTNGVLGASTYLADNRGTQNEQEQNQNQEQNLNQERNQVENPEVNVEHLNVVPFVAQETHRKVFLNNDSSIELSTQDGHFQVKAKHKDGTETELENDSLDLINENLKSEDLEIATASGNRFSIKKGEFEAKTHFPLSINPTTNELTVTTPAGTKVVAILPDAAVNNLIRQKFIDVVASSSAGTDINLDEYASQSAYLINGVAHKKLLGLFPIDINKAAYVSAENGQVLNVTQSLLSRILDFFSTH